MYDRKLSTIPGVLTVVNDNARMPVMIENQIVNVPVLIARGSFQQGNRNGTGYFYFLSDVNNPVTVEYRIQFNWEKALAHDPHGDASAQAAPSRPPWNRRCAQSANSTSMAFTSTSTRRRSGLRREADRGYRDHVAEQSDMDHRHPRPHRLAWRPDYNLALSARRAEAVKQAIIRNHGIAAGRITTSGAGMNEPKAPNDTLQGRAQNRRVELVSNGSIA